MFKKSAQAFSLAGVLLQAAHTAQADTAYITDSVTVGIFASADLSGDPLERLVSGTLVDVLKTNNGMAQVKSSSGKTGWLRTSFLAASLPASIKLENAESELSKLSARLNDANVTITKLKKEAGELKKQAASAKDVGWMRAEMEKARDKAAKLEKQLQSKDVQVTEAGEQSQSFEKQLATLQAENQDLEQRLAAAMLISVQADVQPQSSQVQTDSSAPATFSPWGLLGLIVGLGLGFAAGYYWLDRRLRKRFCGVRVY